MKKKSSNILLPIEFIDSSDILVWAEKVGVIPADRKMHSDFKELYMTIGEKRIKKWQFT